MAKTIKVFSYSFFAFFSQYEEKLNLLLAMFFHMIIEISENRKHFVTMLTLKMKNKI